MLLVALLVKQFKTKDGPREAGGVERLVQRS